MQIIFVFQQRCNIPFPAHGNESGDRKCPFEIQNDVITLDMDLAIVYQTGDEAARVDSHVERTEVFNLTEIDWVRLPGDVFAIQKYTQFLGA